MAIKITKHGQKEFHAFCKWCGCEFTYEISDLKLSVSSDKVSCPTCGNNYHHSMMIQDPTLPTGTGYQWPSDSADPCAGCAWRENLLRDGLYIGDTPCTWCNKNRFNIVTGTSIQGTSTLEQYINPDIKDLDAKYTSSTSCDTNGTKCATAYNNGDDITSGVVMKTILDCCNNATSSSSSNCSDTESRSCSGEHVCGGKGNCKGKH